MTNSPSNNPGYQTKNAAPPPRRHKVTCAICGKRRIYPGVNAFLMDQPTRFARQGRANPWPEQVLSEDIITVPTGAFVCWYHAALKEEPNGSV